jgi:uncharacterized protein YqjF (DUF2071 family)
VSSVFLTAEWRRLLMLSFPIEPRVLRLYTPRGTEIDNWQGATYISVVGFLFLNTKVKGVAIPCHRNFEEINLRFYVRSRGPEGWRRGVVFIREVVPRRAIAWGGRWLYNENYVACPTRSSTSHPSETQAGRAAYSWSHNGHWLTIGADYSGASSYPAEGSEEEFITEHYWGYSVQRDGGTVEYRVEHPQWRVWPAAHTTLDGDLTGFYGAEFASALTRRPSSAFVADGSPVIVRKGSRIRDEASRIRRE